MKRQAILTIIVGSLLMAGLLWLPATLLKSVAGANAQPQLTMGRLGPSVSDQFVEQQITVTNNTAKAFGGVMIDCGFFRAGALVGTGYGLVLNLAANSQAHTYANILASLKPDAVECRISDLR